jgi:hypothetical protein
MKYIYIIFIYFCLILPGVLFAQSLQFTTVKEAENWLNKSIGHVQQDKVKFEQNISINL